MAHGKRLNFYVGEARHRVLVMTSLTEDLPMSEIIRRALGVYLDWDNPEVQRRADSFFAKRAELSQQYGQNNRNEVKENSTGAADG